MNTKRNALYFRVAVIAAVLLLPAASLLAQPPMGDFLAYPPDSQPFGMTYGDWSAAYWQYVFSIPASTNPLLDTTGSDCAVGQSSGPVFFLNTTPVSGASVKRLCTVPFGKALWIPNSIAECSNLETPPDYGGDPQQARTCAGAYIDGVSKQTVKFTVDGMKISPADSFRVVSPNFTFTMPAQDNILGLDGVTSGSSVSDGYFLMLRPLPRGHHVIHFEGAYLTGPGAGTTCDVTYYLTVQ